MSQNQRSLHDFFSLNPPAPRSYPNQAAPQRPPPPTITSYLRLPHHTRRLWQFAKGHLIVTATKQNLSIEGILEIICAFIIECRIIKQADIDISLLSQYLNKNDNLQTLDLFAKIASYALECELLFNEPIEILTKYSNKTLKLSHRQIRCLMSLMFFCCLPKQENAFDLPKDYTYAKVFNKSYADAESQMAKIDCAMNYFKRQENPDEHFMSFTRKSLTHFPDWETLRKPLSKVELINLRNGTEDFRDKLMVDFANKYIAGGALTSGAVQEEIMLHKHVQPLVSVLFTEKLEDQEALFIKGSQRFNETVGYKDQFRFEDDFHESIVIDAEGINDCYIVAIDASYFKGTEHLQYTRGNVLREINKAFVGFSGDTNDRTKRDVISGRWGCGAFGGDEQLKFVIQWLAASAAERELHYLLWDTKNPEQLQEFIRIASNFSIDKLFQVLIRTGRVSEVLATMLTYLRQNT